MNLDQHRIKEILGFDAEQRLKYLIKQITESQKIWILTDEHGAVMMTTEDEDCIPVWPNREFAEMWATDDWQGFTAISIPYKDWLNKWTRGLEQDELSVVVFPIPDDDGVILFPDEFEFELKSKMNKR
ncbi:MAG: DUF2750 domain-containing protein [Gammaproteobacteria bacterium]|nr:DUF2750 domain-containing protein [Gammaproteobacteria bacterium]